MSNQLPLPLVPVATVTGNGYGPSIDIGTVRAAAKLNVVATSLDGAMLSVDVGTSPDGVVWRTAGGVQRETVGSSELVLVGLDRFVRVDWNLDGTEAALEVAGAARQLYATSKDLEALSLGQNILQDADWQKLNRALVHGSDLAAGYLGSQYALPLLAWGDDLAGHTAAVAAYRFMVSIGYSPEGRDEHIRTMYEDAIRWFERIAKGELSPDGIVDSTPDINEGGPVILTTKKRGW